MVNSIVMSDIYHQNAELNVLINGSNTTQLIESKKVDLSFIIATRNDNYGSNPTLRLRFTLQNLLLYEWKSLHNITIEIIIIEWNAVSINPHIWQYPEIDYLLKHKHSHDGKIKFYSIPSYYNDRININSKYSYCPFFEYFPKNVGLRRSNGEWKMIMNIDDLWGQNLLYLIGSSIENKSLDTNGIYQARQNHIGIANISSYTNIPTIIPIENILNHTVFDHDELNTICFRKPRGPRERSSVWPSGGDFLLIHNNSLYNYFGGGFLELAASDDVDSEFIERQIKVNKLNTYYIKSECSYYHIDHLEQKHERNTYIKFIRKRHPKISCDQTRDPTMTFRYIRNNNNLPNDTMWAKRYEQLDKHWGIKDVQFDFVQF